MGHNHTVINSTKHKPALTNSYMVIWLSGEENNSAITCYMVTKVNYMVSILHTLPYYMGMHAILV